MIAIDTNVLVRIFIDDLNHEQVTKARELARKAKHIYLTQIVIVEMVWVLIRAYQLTKPQVLNILQEIYENSAFILEQEKKFSEAFILYRNHNVDFSDCMILAAAKAANLEHIYTFDTKFSRLANVKKL